MSNFIYDKTGTPNGKSDARALPVPASQGYTAAEWNQLCQALLDTQGVLLGAKFYGYTKQGVQPTPPTGTNDFLWLDTSIRLHLFSTSDWMIPVVGPLGSLVKGDLFPWGGSDFERLAAGADGMVLTANAGSAFGVEWAVPGAAANYTNVLGGAQVLAAARSQIVYPTNGNVTLPPAADSTVGDFVDIAVSSGGGTLTADATLATVAAAALVSATLYGSSFYRCVYVGALFGGDDWVVKSWPVGPSPTSVQSVVAAGATAIDLATVTTRYDGAAAGNDITSTLPDGSREGERHTAYLATITVAKTVVITPTTFADGTTVTLSAPFDSVEFEWHAATGYLVVGLSGTALVA